MEISPQIIHILPVIIPLMTMIPTIGDVLFTHRRRLHLLFTLVVIMLNIITCLSLPISGQIYYYGFFSVKIDIYSYIFLLAVNITWLIIAIYSYCYLRINFRDFHLRSFYHYISLAITCVSAVGIAGDLVTLFTFYQLLTLATYPLIIHRRTEEAYKAGERYLLTLLGTTFIFYVPAMIIVYNITGTTSFIETGALAQHHVPTMVAIILMPCFIYGLSKNAVYPFHRWLTDASIVAPAPVSALLHSVAAVKAGSIAIIKVAVYVYGLDYLRILTSNFWTGGWVFWVCGGTAVYAALKAWKTDDIKERFAFSTVSQLSYIINAIFAASPLLILAAIMHIASHSIAKVSLFLVAGIFRTFYKTTNTYEIAKIAPNEKFLVFCVAIAGMSIIGLPLFSGFYSKDYMLMAEWKSHDYAAAVSLLIGTFINVLYIYPIVKAGFFTKKYVKAPAVRLPRPIYLALILTLIGNFAFAYFAADMVKILKGFI